MKASSLPLPHEDALAHSHALHALIAKEVAASGCISFERYMQLALYAPVLGYYAGGAQKFGRDGDFTTAPELTPLFAQALAAQAAEVLRQGGLTQVLEFGAGTGQLAAQLLKALRTQHNLQPRYFVLDVSAELRARQRETLQRIAPECAAQVTWLDALPEHFEGLVLANEVLDAMPVQVVVKRGEAWRELCVTVNKPGDALEFTERDSMLAPPAAWAQELPEGYTTELHAQAHAFVRTMGQWFKRGVALFIDYGFPEHEYYHPERSTGTLIAHYQHRANPDVLAWPGLQDITAHVNFTDCAVAAQEAGLDVLGYTTQARFLMNCGILNLLERVEEASRLRETGAVQKLLAEHEMGELFKVLAVARAYEHLLQGFAQGNRLERL